MERNVFHIEPNRLNRTTIRPFEVKEYSIKEGVKVTRVQKAFRTGNSRMLAEGVCPKIIENKIRTSEGRKWLVSITDSKHIRTVNCADNPQPHSLEVHSPLDLYSRSSSWKQDLASTIRTENSCESTPNWDKIQQITEEHQIIQEPIHYLNTPSDRLSVPRQHNMKRSMQEIEIKEQIEENRLYASTLHRKPTLLEEDNITENQFNFLLKKIDAMAEQQKIVNNSLLKMHEKTIQHVAQLSDRVETNQRKAEEQERINDLKHYNAMIHIQKVNEKLELMLNKFSHK